MEESAVIISCPRTEGDGMECSDDRIAPSHSDFEVAAAADGLASLDVSPSKSLDRVITLIPQITRSAVASTHAKKSPGASQSEKKLKFVPYEPYKAAVKPIIPYKKKEKKPVVPVHTEFRDSPPHPVAASGTIGGNDKELEKIRKEKEELESQLKIHSRVNPSHTSIDNRYNLLFFFAIRSTKSSRGCWSHHWEKTWRPECTF